VSDDNTQDDGPEVPDIECEAEDVQSASSGLVCEELPDPFEGKRQEITEEDSQDVIKGWYEEAKKQTADTISDFVKHLVNDYQHDYGTICHACAAAAVGATWAVDHDKFQGGITGFQAGAIMWEYVKHWLHKEGPLRLQEMYNLLYPQYERHFNAIHPRTWEAVQAEARRRVAEVEAGDNKMCESVFKHMKSIAEGNVPFGLKIDED